MNICTIEQILPKCITDEMKIKKALCVIVEKKATKSVMDRLKAGNYSLEKVYLIDEESKDEVFLDEYQMSNQEMIDLDNKDIRYKEYDCSFLKRVKTKDDDLNYILVGFEEHLKCIKKDDSIIYNEILIDKKLWVYVDIPYTQPITEVHCDYCKEKWPIAYLITSKEKYIYSHDQSEIETIEDIVSYLNKQFKEEKIECMLYNPSIKKIIAMGKRIDNIINHSIMNLIDNHSNNQLNSSSAIEPNTIISIGEKSMQGPLDNSNILYGNSSQYYCEGLYVFSIYEPCIMCSMALVHNRIARIYFMNHNLKDGGLVSKIAINNYKINYHYHIFNIKL